MHFIILAQRFVVTQGLTKGNIDARKTEIVDLSDPYKNCKLLDDIPFLADDAKGGLFGENVVICGGNGIYNGQCIFNSKSLKIPMRGVRRHALSVRLNSTMLWIIGGMKSKPHIGVMCFKKCGLILHYFKKKSQNLSISTCEQNFPGLLNVY